MNAYRFGTRTADFLHCARCGILMAATCEIEGSTYAVLNLNNVDGLDAATLPATAFDFDGEETDDRLARRRNRWMPVTTGTTSN